MLTPSRGEELPTCLALRAAEQGMVAPATQVSVLPLPVLGAILIDS